MRIPPRKDLFDRAHQLFESTRCSIAAYEIQLSGIMQNPDVEIGEVDLRVADSRCADLMSQVRQSLELDIQRAVALFAEIVLAIRGEPA